MGRLVSLIRPRIGKLPFRIQSQISDRSEKRVDSHYRTKEHKSWARRIFVRAGGRCEQVEDGKRCPKAHPEHRMFADHIVERADGGAPYDDANGQLLCGSHHTIKTNIERGRRAGVVMG